MKRSRDLSALSAGFILLLSLSVTADYATEAIVPPSVIFETLALNRDLPTPQQPKYLSPVDMVPSPDGMLLFVAEQTAKRIDVINVKSQTVLGRVALPNEVTGLAIAPDGTALYATCSSDLWPAGMLYVISVASGRVLKRIPVGFGARSPVVTPDGGKIYVCARFENDIAVVNVAAGSVERRIPVVREPFCAAVTPNGKTLVVGNLLPGGFSNDTGIIDAATSCRISIIDAAADTVCANIAMTRGSTNVAGIAVSPDGKYAFATHQIGKCNLIATTVEKGWMHTNNLAMIDLAAKRFVNDICLDKALMGMADPWALRFSGDGKFMCISHAGPSRLSIIDYAAMIDTVLARTARNEDIQKEFTVLLKSRQIVNTGTACPRALAVIGTMAYTAGYFADTLPCVKQFELSLATTSHSWQISLGEPRVPTVQRQGDALICDANLTFQTWHTCSSCHTGGRADGLNWVLGGGAVVAPKNTRSFVYSWWTPPTTWAGRRGAATSAIAAAMELELFRVATRELTAPIDTLFMSLKPVPSPHLVKGRLSSDAGHGRELFYDTTKVSCRKCHIPPLFTDMKFWNAGVADPYEPNTPWKTPHFAEAWRTSPYNHLGSMRIGEMIRLSTMDAGAKDLSAQEVDDLAEYVLSL